jgi:hypothetical protein
MMNHAIEKLDVIKAVYSVPFYDRVKADKI